MKYAKNPRNAWQVKGLGSLYGKATQFRQIVVSVPRGVLSIKTDREGKLFLLLRVYL